uniref:NAD(P)H quinone oxidoreductase n=1 Tax=Thermosporothrix sp. COM3 TaxID=2490863 RepID=A0A455SGM5_9CHLR|nr:NAD(P)H quinone oxidoreductase [Thermosporothrix sp. COM3]
MHILVLVHSQGGNCLTLAELAVKGVESIPGIRAELKRVPDLETEEALRAHPWTGRVYAERIHPLPVARIDDLARADGLIIGSGTRYGGMSAAMKYFLEQASPLWRTNALLGRPAGVMSVASTPHGGVEQATLGMMVQLMHLGMLLVPCGYATPLLQRAGSPYGAMAIAGGAAGRTLSEDELAVAHYLGQRVAEVALRLGPKQLQA